MKRYVAVGVLLVLIAGIYVYSVTPHQPAFLSAGNMKFVKATAPFDNRLGPISKDNINALFSEPIEVSGTYSYVSNAEGFTGACMTVATTSVQYQRIPHIETQDEFFCFRNEADAVAALGNSEHGKNVSVRIDNFELNRYPSEVVDWADFKGLSK